MESEDNANNVQDDISNDTHRQGNIIYKLKNINKNIKMMNML